jgi:hypothetical protein
MTEQKTGVDVTLLGLLPQRTKTTASTLSGTNNPTFTLLTNALRPYDIHDSPVIDLD